MDMDNFLPRDYWQDRVDVGRGFFPPRVSCLVITQYLEYFDEPPYWAYIVVGTFFDDEETIVWSTEIFILDGEVYTERDYHFSASETDSDLVQGSDETSGESGSDEEPAYVTSQGWWW